MVELLNRRKGCIHIDIYVALNSVTPYLSGYVESYLEGLNIASITSLHGAFRAQVPSGVIMHAESGIVACHVCEGPHKLIVCPPQAFWAICTKSDF